MARRSPLLLLALLSVACAAEPDAGQLETLDGGSDAGPGAEDAGTGADAGPGSSRGSGGLPCESTATVSSGGTSYDICVARVGAVELKIVEPAPDDSGAPLRLAVYLHGDGARAHTGNTAPRLQAPWTYAHRTLYVSARAPNGCAWWLKPSYTACDGTLTQTNVDTAGENARALEQAIAALRAGWDLADEAVLFGGSSGGAIFLTASFLPLYGDRFPGGYALNCGGAAPWAGALAWDGTDPALLGPTRLFFTYNAEDPVILEDTEQGVAYYRGLGFPLDETVLPGTEHCAFDHLGRTVEVWAEYTGQ